MKFLGMLTAIVPFGSVPAQFVYNMLLCSYKACVGRPGCSSGYRSRRKVAGDRWVNLVRSDPQYELLGKFLPRFNHRKVRKFTMFENSFVGK